MSADSSMFGIERALASPLVPAAPPPVRLQAERQTPADHKDLGRAARIRVPRESHGAWSAPANRADPIALLEEQASTRIPELAPIRYGRMLASPFAFYCGAAAIMAADLANTPQSGFHVQLCGDAHLSNFGGFASPDGDIVFDIYDFDETLPGPWEWDVKLLATSMYVAGRIRACDNEDCRALVLATVSAYRRAMHEFAALPFAAVRRSRLDRARVAKGWGQKLRPTELRASEIAVTKSVLPIGELLSETQQRAAEGVTRSFVLSLKQSPRGNARHILESYEHVHMARQAVAVGSVGLRSWVLLLRGKDYEQSHFLQFKEAQASALAPYIAPVPHAGHGERIVEGQRLLQAEPDIFLGWRTVDDMPGDTPRDYYVRQLWDWKVSADVERMPLRQLLVHGEMCGWALARAHACSGDRLAIAQYLGKGPAFDKAIAEFSRLHARQNEHDYEALRTAVERGVVKAQRGV